MLEPFLLLLPLAALALFSEWLWRKKRLSGEGGRKLVHIIAGIWIGLWPFFTDYRNIQWLTLLLFAVLIASKFFNIFRSVHDVDRKTVGEFFYPLTILICATLAPPAWIFTLAVFYLALSDGLAALMGTRYRKIAITYKVFGQTKSVLGTITYFASALACSILVYNWLAPSDGVLLQDYMSSFLMVAIAATALENILPYGSDNLVIPVMVVLLLA